MGFLIFILVLYLCMSGMGRMLWEILCVSLGTKTWVDSLLDQGRRLIKYHPDNVNNQGLVMLELTMLEQEIKKDPTNLELWGSYYAIIDFEGKSYNAHMNNISTLIESGKIKPNN